MALGSKAHFLYGQNTPSSTTNDLVPRSKFNFTVSMTHRSSAALGGLSTTLFERISSVSMPSYSVKSMTLNQYNKKRVVQTGIEYAPITMLAYDDRSGQLEKFLKEYSEYYYAGSMNYGTSFIEFNNASAGTKLQEKKNFIQEITIVRKNSATDINTIKIYNPLITSIDADTLDYSDSGLVQYRISFIYEGYDITSNDYEIPQPLKSNNDDRIFANQQQVAEAVSQASANSSFEQEDDLVETNSVNENVIDDRDADEKVSAQGDTQVLDADGVKSYDNMADALSDPNAQPGDVAVIDGKTHVAQDSLDPNDPVYYEETNAAIVDNSAVDTSTVVAESTDATGAPSEQIIEETSVEPDGTTQTRTFKETPKPTEYRVHDQYVDVPVENIPDDRLDEIIRSGAYYEGEDGTLKNYADDRPFTEINREAIDTTKWVNKDAVKGVGYDSSRNKFRAYNPSTKTYSYHDTVEEANTAAVKGVE